jgi:hypothetical protein
MTAQLVHSPAAAAWFPRRGLGGAVHTVVRMGMAQEAELIEELQAMPDDEGECTAKAATAEKLSLVSQWPSRLVVGSPSSPFTSGCQRF